MSIDSLNEYHSILKSSDIDSILKKLESMTLQEMSPLFKGVSLVPYEDWNSTIFSEEFYNDTPYFKISLNDFLVDAEHGGLLALWWLYHTGQLERVTHFIYLFGINEYALTLLKEVPSLGLYEVPLELISTMDNVEYLNVYAEESQLHLLPKKLKYLELSADLSDISPLLHLQDLEFLQFYGAEILTLNRISELKSLHSLSLHADLYVENLQGLLAAKNIRRLHFENINVTTRYESLRNREVIDLLPQLTWLEELDIDSYNENLIDKDTFVKMLSPLSSLKSLSTNLFHGVNLNFLSPFKSLEKLCIYNASEEISLWPLTSCTSLESVKFDCKVSPSSFQALKSLPRLTQLRVCKIDSTEAINSIPFALIQDLMLEFSSELEQVNLDALLDAKKLKKLRIKILNNDNLDILHNLTSIETLIITDSLIQNVNFLKSLYRLKNLEISSCNQLTEINAISSLRFLDNISIFDNKKLKKIKKKEVHIQSMTQLAAYLHSVT